MNSSNATNFVCILLGSNIQPIESLRKAIYLLSKELEINSISTAWESPPMGSDGPNFLNLAVTFYTNYNLLELKQKILRPIENQLGRVRTPDKYAPRTIDIDVVIWNDEQLDNDLWQYAHVAVPISQILPNIKSPASGESLSNFANRIKKIFPIYEKPEVLNNLHLYNHDQHRINNRW